MKNPEDIYTEISHQEFDPISFIRRHKIGILGTVAFHLAILVFFLFSRIQTFKEIHELALVLEFPEEKPVKTPEELQAEKRAAFYDRLLEQQLNQSNKAVNVNELEEELSTENYVDQVMKELDENRSEEFLKEQERLRAIMEQEDYVPENQESVTEEEAVFHGPTNIRYSFLTEPLDRKTRYLPVPVYKCQGEGTVEVSISVNQQGDVTSAKARVITATKDPECLAQVAESFAKKTRFRASMEASANHEGIITYQFIAQ